MNERIKELERQCWSHRVAGTLVDGQLHFDTKKFAELIVRECSEVVDSMANDEDSDLYFWAIQNASQKIKEHFGIE